MPSSEFRGKARDRLLANHSYANRRVPWRHSRVPWQSQRRLPLASIFSCTEIFLQRQVTNVAINIVLNILIFIRSNKATAKTDRNNKRKYRIYTKIESLQSYKVTSHIQFQAIFFSPRCSRLFDRLCFGCFLKLAFCCSDKISPVLLRIICSLKLWNTASCCCDIAPRYCCSPFYPLMNRNNYALYLVSAYFLSLSNFRQTTKQCLTSRAYVENVSQWRWQLTRKHFLICTCYMRRRHSQVS